MRPSKNFETNFPLTSRKYTDLINPRSNNYKIMNNWNHPKYNHKFSGSTASTTGITNSPAGIPGTTSTSSHTFSRKRHNMRNSCLTVNHSSCMGTTTTCSASSQTNMGQGQNNYGNNTCIFSNSTNSQSTNNSASFNHHHNNNNNNLNHANISLFSTNHVSSNNLITSSPHKYRWGSFWRNFREFSNSLRIENSLVGELIEEWVFLERSTFRLS